MKPRPSETVQYERPRARRNALLAEASRVLVVALAAVGGASLALTAANAAHWSCMVVSTLIFTVIAIVALAQLPHHQHDRFGPANTITTARAALTALVGAMGVNADSLAGADSTGLAWAGAAAAGLAMALDGLDGIAARYTHLSSAFGQRFDMEIDALLILFLSGLLFASGKLGVWIILIGAIRYVFIAARRVIPGLRAPLVFSHRRRAVCAAQGIVLCLALVPWVSAGLASIIAAGAMVALVYSFGADIVILLRGGRVDQPGTGEPASLATTAVKRSEQDVYSG